MYKLEIDVPRDLQKNDYGFDIVCTISDDEGAVDISGATEGIVVFDNPEKNGIFTKNLDFVTDGTDGKAFYKFENGMLDIHGTWQVQCKLTMPSKSFHTSFTSFSVDSNIAHE